MKDFYDIHYLATTLNFDGRILQEAIYKTITNRGRNYEKDSVQAIGKLAETPELQKRWDSFCKKILKEELAFSKIVNTIIDFTAPPYESIIQRETFLKTWSYIDKKYIDAEA